MVDVKEAALVLNAAVGILVQVIPVVHGVTGRHRTLEEIPGAVRESDPLYNVIFTFVGKKQTKTKSSLLNVKAWF